MPRTRGQAVFEKCEQCGAHGRYIFPNGTKSVLVFSFQEAQTVLEVALADEVINQEEFVRLIKEARRSMFDEHLEPICPIHRQQKREIRQARLRAKFDAIRKTRQAASSTGSSTASATAPAAKRRPIPQDENYHRLLAQHGASLN